MTTIDDAARRRAAASLRTSAGSWKEHDPWEDARFASTAADLSRDLGVALGYKPCDAMAAHEFLSRLADFIEPAGKAPESAGGRRPESLESNLAHLVEEHPGRPIVVMAYDEGDEKACGFYLQGPYRALAAEVALFDGRSYDDEDEFIEDYVEKWFRINAQVGKEELKARARRLWEYHAISCIAIYATPSLVDLKEII